jgi:hypothetical protein
MTYNPNSGYSGYAGYGTPQDQALRLAQAQLAEGASTAPIRSKWQGVARLAQALQGGLTMRNAHQAGAANAAYLQPGGNGTAGATGATGGLPAAPGALADLANSVGPVPDLTDADFNGLKDSDIMGPGPQQGPPRAAMAPNNSATGPAMTAQASNPMVAALAGALTGAGGPQQGAGGQIDPSTGLPMGGVQVASNDPNFAPGPQSGFQAPSAVSQPSTGNASGNGSGVALVAMQQARDAANGGNGGAIAQPPAAGGQFNPADLAMFRQDMQAVPGQQGGSAVQGGLGAPTGSIMSHLSSMGYSPNAAAGIIGNFQQESGLNPSSIGDGGTSGGLGQWHTGRFAGLQAFAQQYVTTWQPALWLYRHR